MQPNNTVRQEERMPTIYPDFERDGYFLEHAVMLSQIFPATFEILPKNERFGIHEGDIVKLGLCFAKEDAERKDFDTERIWVVAKRRFEDHWIGVLDNDPRYHQVIKAGHELHFHADHIFSIWRDAPKA
jgi:hypothetical protein